VETFEALSWAAAGGAGGLRALRVDAGSTAVREACNRLIDVLAGRDDTGPAFVAGALAASAESVRERQYSSVEVVWTGPETDRVSGRLTLAVVRDLTAMAEQDLLLVSYAAHTDGHLAAALDRAAARGVAITLLLERTEDNPEYASWSGMPFPALGATRLAWPVSQRPPAGAALHLECGLLIRGHSAARTIRAHVAQLRAAGILQAVG
jgi:hypothetical protein